MRAGIFALIAGFTVLGALGCDEGADRERPARDGSLFDSQTDGNRAWETGTRPDATEITEGRDSGGGVCQACDSTEPANPVVNDSEGTGSVTTYGSVSDPEPSRGGACNYGNTQIHYFAAINVNIESGDGLGQWQGGRICGQCALVRAETPAGYKETVVRVTDKCADQYCGIDLGGAPAAQLMGNRPGRYGGSWKFVSCDAMRGVSDGPASIYVKDGSNPWWALIQVRNGRGAVRAISWRGTESTKSGDFAYATEAENFFSVPEEVRTTAETIRLSITYRDLSTDTLDIAGNALTEPGTSIALEP
jgi:expansin (peptidoglycan-binding protein)